MVVEHVPLAEGNPPGQQLEQRHAEGVEVGAVIELGCLADQEPVVGCEALGPGEELADADLGETGEFVTGQNSEYSIKVLDAETSEMLFQYKTSVTKALVR